MLRGLRRSLETSLAAAALALVFGAGCALLLGLTDIRFKAGFVFLVMVPMMIPPHVTAIAWIQSLGPTSVLLRTLGIAPPLGSTHPLYSPGGIVLLLAIQHAPLVMLLVRAGLRALPGIGPYTAAAVAAIAHDRPAAVMDGNVERVMARLHAVETPLPDVKPVLHALAARLTPEDRPGDHAQAVMDLGATICSPRSPACGICPWRDPCAGRAAGIAETLPRKAPKAAKPTPSAGSQPRAYCERSGSPPIASASSCAIAPPSRMAQALAYDVQEFWHAPTA